MNFKWLKIISLLFLCSVLFLQPVSLRANSRKESISSYLNLQDYWQNRPVDNESEWIRSGEYYYEYLDKDDEYSTNKKYIIVRKIESNSKKIVIPSIIDGKKVIGVGVWLANDYFPNHENTPKCVLTKNSGVVQELIVSEGIEYIGQWAFAGAINLRKLSLPQTLIYIDNAAFDRTRLNQLDLPKNVRTGEYVFWPYTEDINEKFYWKTINVFSKSLSSGGMSKAICGLIERLNIRFYKEKRVVIGGFPDINKIYVDSGIENASFFAP